MMQMEAGFSITPQNNSISGQVFACDGTDVTEDKPQCASSNYLEILQDNSINLSEKETLRMNRHCRTNKNEYICKNLTTYH